MRLFFATVTAQFVSTIILTSSIAYSDTSSSTLTAPSIDFSIRVPREVEGTYGIKIKMSPSANPFPSILYKTAVLKQIEGDRYLMTEWNCRADSGTDPRQSLSLSQSALQSIPPLTFEVRAWKDADDQIFIEAKNVVSSIQSVATLTGNPSASAIPYSKISHMDYSILREQEATYSGTIKEASQYTLGSPASGATATAITNVGTLEMLRFEDDPACESMFWDNTFAK